MTEQDVPQTKDSLFTKHPPVVLSSDTGLPQDGWEATVLENECSGVDDQDAAEGAGFTVQSELKRYAMLHSTMQHLED
jgi:hypothetical protein